MSILRTWRISAALFAAFAAALGGCHEPLMPTPVVYEDVRFSPCYNVPDELRSTSMRVFYATTRTPSGDADSPTYSNKPSDDIHVGEAIVSIGPRSVTWDELAVASVSARRDRTLTVHVEARKEFGALAAGRSAPQAGPAGALTAAEQAWVDGINDAMRRSKVDKVFMYIHGAKVDFDHACELAGELYHFLGRAGAAVAFAWPTGQSLLSYGSDVKQGRIAGNDVARVLDLLSRTEAEQIDIISYSAGARPLAEGLVVLREAHPDLDEAALAARFRVFDVVFAAADISTERFATDLLPRMYDLPRRIQITTSDQDGVLALARLTHGSSRVGRPDVGELDEATVASLRQLRKFLVIDTSYAQRERSLAIPGHGYWFRNPWAATDTLLALRFDASPEQRGLVWGGEERPLSWYFPPDYRERVVTALLSGMGLPPDATFEQVLEWTRMHGRATDRDP